MSISSSSTTTGISGGTTNSSTIDSTDGTSTDEGTGGMSGSSSGTTTDDASTDDATGSDDSTSSAAAVCGDAVLAPVEECDDGNEQDDDGCNRHCKRDRIVFATSEEFTPEFIQGLQGADGICIQLAGAAGLANALSFTAWLSDSHVDAIDRVFHGEGRYVRTDGKPIAANFVALLHDRENPIAADEHGAPALGSAWTGTLPDGRRAPGSSHCLDWTTDDPFTETGYYGHCDTIDSRWTYEYDPDTSPGLCGTQLRIYCFEGK